MLLFGSEITLDFVARVIQMSLTPVFLLTGLATMLNVFSTRLTRVTAKADQTIKELAGAEMGAAQILRDQLVSLRRRSLALDIAVILIAAAGAATCTTVLLLFLGGFGGGIIGHLLLWVFAAAVTFALGAVGAYTTEMLMAGTGIRAELVHGARRHLRRHRSNDT